MTTERLPVPGRRLLTKPLTAGFPGAAELRGQVAPVEDGLLPAAGTVRDGSGELLGELLVRVSGGRLSPLECAWYGDAAPARLPDPGLVTVTVDETAMTPDPGGAPGCLDLDRRGPRT